MGEHKAKLTSLSLLIVRLDEDEKRGAMGCSNENGSSVSRTRLEAHVNLSKNPADDGRQGTREH